MEGGTQKRHRGNKIDSGLSAGKQSVMRFRMRNGLSVRLSSEKDPGLRRLSGRESLGIGISLMAHSLNVLFASLREESDGAPLQDVHRDMRRLLARFSALDHKWVTAGHGRRVW
ncbi:MAG: hypothetical protein HY652_15215 [Acidobacteria bacterium]|nr:hypothetical protein [Acidobacteriota bacterium]